MRPIGGLFGRSPFGPAHEHLLKTIECLKRVVPLFEAASKGDFDGVRRVTDEIQRIEQEADDLKKAIRTQFTTSFFASVDRSEMMSLVKAQDDVADECERLAKTVAVRRTAVPAFLGASFNAMASRVTAMVEPLAEAARILDRTGGRPGGSDLDAIKSRLEAIHSTIADVEKHRDDFLRILFDREQDAPVLDVIFLLRFGEGVDNVIHKIENIADVTARLLPERE